ncbi:hypothetical protein [Pseudohongiella sp. O18]|uniref:hypothetical protein n=1 Tax=Pseudohongiella sp. O18 TaxID=2904248 RepID=UPI001F45896C|nr:hypothetical protein [Pseudohongiella sp. O18]
MDIANIEIGIDTRPLSKGEDSLRSLAVTGGRTEKQLNQSTQRAEQGFSTLTKSIAATSAVLAGVGVYRVVDGFKQTIVETERLRGSLVTVTGSVDGASEAFARLTEFAEQTPFTLDQSVTAFIRLKSLGLDPSERALRSYGNTAAAMGKDMMQMIEAVADASTFEFERLKEFGIRAKQQGDEVALTFQGVTTVVDKESAAIEEYLTRIGENQFGTAMEDQMERIPGMLSNLEDAVDGFFRKIGDDGATDAFAGGIQAATVAVEGLTENLDTLVTIGQVVATIYAGKVAASIATSATATYTKIAANVALLKSERDLANSALQRAVQEQAAAARSLQMAHNDTLRAGAITRLAAANQQLTASQVAANAATAAYTRTATLGGRALGILGRTAGFLGGPAGIIATVGLAAWQLSSAFSDVSDTADEATNSISGLNDELEEMGSAHSRQLQTEITATSMMLNQAVAVYGANSEQVQQLLIDLELLRNEYNALTGSTEGATQATGEMSDKASEVVAKLKDEIEMIGMTDRERAVHIALRQAEVDAASATGQEIKRLAELRYDEEEAADAQAEAEKKLTDALDDQAEKVSSMILAERQRQASLALSGRQREIYNAIVRAGFDQSPQDLAAIAREVGLRYDQEEAIRVATEATDDAARAAEQLREEEAQLAKQMQEDWAETRREFGRFWADMVQDGENAFDALANSFERMLLEMTGQLALSGLAKLFNIQTPGGAAGGIQGILDSSGFAGDAAGALLSRFGGQLGQNSGLTDILSGLGLRDAVQTGADWSTGLPTATQGGFNANQLISGLKDLGMNIGAGFAGGFAGNELGEAIFGKEAESALGQSIGTAIGTYLGGPLGAFIGSSLGSMVDVMTGGDGKVRQNAGFLVAPTPGADPSRTFQVDPFSSGLQVTGFARRADQAQAIQVIEQFRGVHDVFFGLIEQLGGKLDTSRATLAGLDEEATPGSLGTFMGLGGNGQLAGDLLAQINYFIDQLADYATGLDEALLDSIRSAGSAEAAISLLSTALIEQEAEAVAAAEAAESSAAATKKAAEAEARLQKERLDAIESMLGEMESIRSMRQSMQAQSYELMGVSPLFQIDATVTDQIRHIEQMRDLLTRQHQDELRAEEQLHNQRMRLAQSISDYTVRLQLGEFSNLSGAGQLDLAQSQFRQLASAALSGDMDAAARIENAAEAYVTAADREFASGAGRRDVVTEVLAVMDQLGGSLGSSTFDPSAANQALLNALAGLDSELAEIASGVNGSIIDELKGINGKLSDLPPAMASQLAGVMSAFLQSAGNMQRTVESYGSGTLARSAGEKVLTDQGFNLNYTADQIIDHIAAIGGIGSGDFERETAAIRQIYNDAVAAGIGSAQLADVGGYTQSGIYEALRAAGIDPTGFAQGGISTGPTSGHLEMLHGTELIVPMNNGLPGPVRTAANDGAMVREIQSLNNEVVRLRETVAMIGEDAASQRDRQARIDSEMNDELKRVNGRKAVGNIG